ncbi:MAG: hypothetical protein ACI9XC_000289 [Gammaproteobacteria bacterium]|jgi:hypothetical protein
MATHDLIVISDYISVVVKGALSVSDFMNITDEMLKASQEKSIHKVVIDVSGAAGTFSDSDKIEFATYAVDNLKDDIIKYAYVFPHELLNYYSQKVAQGRGFNARAFYSMEDALNWIEDE